MKNRTRARSLQRPPRHAMAGDQPSAGRRRALPPLSTPTTRAASSPIATVATSISPQQDCQLGFVTRPGHQRAARPPKTVNWRYPDKATAHLEVIPRDRARASP